MICHLGAFNSTVYWPFNAYAAQPVWCHHWVGHCGFLQEVTAGCCTHAITEFEISQRWTETLPEYQLFLTHFRSGVEYICIQWFPIFISVFFSNYTMPVTELATKATLHVSPQWFIFILWEPSNLSKGQTVKSMEIWWAPRTSLPIPPAHCIWISAR